MKVMKQKIHSRAAAVLLTLTVAHGAQAQPEWRSWGGAASQTSTQSSGSIPTTASQQMDGTAVMMSEMLRRIDQLENELRDLRGQLEVQSNLVERLQRAQRDGFADLDSRIARLENRVAGDTPALQSAAVPTQPPTAAVRSPRSSEPVATTSEHMPTSSATRDQRALYDRAFALLREGRYEEAIKEFDRTIAANPAGNWAPHALYWKGEAQYVSQDRLAARASFQQLLSRYGDSSRAADASLKIALLDYDEGKYQEARNRLERIVADYPGTQAAGLAQQRLNRMTQEGR